MINPIIFIVAGALLMSVLMVAVLNRPRKPIVTGMLILLLIAFIAMTLLVDGGIVSMRNSTEMSGIVSFVAMTDTTSTVEQLEDTFRTLMAVDCVLIAMTLLSLLAEMILILRRDYRK